MISTEAEIYKPLIEAYCSDSSQGSVFLTLEYELKLSC